MQEEELSTDVPPALGSEGWAGGWFRELEELGVEE